jgi:F-type H+-transporting ATPase subunit gamma
MNLVATIKYKKSRDKVEHVRLYLEDLKGNIGAVRSDDYRNELMLPREVKKSLFVVIASDRGLCGAFNSSIVKKAMHSVENKNVVFMTVGHKARDFFQKRQTVAGSFSNSDNVEMKFAASIAANVIKLYKSGEIDEVFVFYNEFVSTIKFEPSVIKLLPLTFEESSKEKAEKENTANFTYESSPSDILDRFIPKYIAAIIYEKLLEASASEQSSRMTAMSNATENATKIIDELSMKYNRARQASITNEISEIVGGTEALK